MTTSVSAGVIARQHIFNLAFSRVAIVRKEGILFHVFLSIHLPLFVSCTFQPIIPLHDYLIILCICSTIGANAVIISLHDGSTFRLL